METFYYSYKGNKRNEIKHIQNLLETHKDSYNKFVEAFGGTCAMSRYIYENYKDKEIYINDVNKDLTFFANNFHKCCDTVISHIKDVVKSINNEQEYKQYYKKANTEKDNETDLIERLVYILFIIAGNNKGISGLFIRYSKNIVNNVSSKYTISSSNLIYTSSSF